jgi:hypothetical protein
MENNDLKEIDELIKSIKQKTDRIGMSAADIFIILTLEILRGEILSEQGITELTISACNEITSTTAHYYYYRDYPALYKYLQQVFDGIAKLDTRFTSADIICVGFEKKDWNDYLVKAIQNLLNNSSTHYFYQKQSK